MSVGVVVSAVVVGDLVGVAVDGALVNVLVGIVVRSLVGRG